MDQRDVLRESLLGRVTTLFDIGDVVVDTPQKREVFIPCDTLELFSAVIMFSALGGSSYEYKVVTTTRDKTPRSPAEGTTVLDCGSLLTANRHGVTCEDPAILQGEAQSEGLPKGISLGVVVTLTGTEGQKMGDCSVSVTYRAKGYREL